MAKYTKANLFNVVGKRTPCFVRFSTVAGERGAADTQRDPRGFACKFYTEEGIYDIVGNNTPVFFIRDPMKFPDFIHSQKRDPKTNCKHPNSAWDFWVQRQEALHQVTILFSDRGTPDGFRFMNGYGSHTFKWVNEDGEAFLIKYHFKTDSGIKNLTAEDAGRLESESPDYATQDLYDHISNGGVASWSVYVQILSLEEGEKYHWDVYDVTKVWPQSEVPLIPVGKMVLNRNPENYFAETEQAAFAPTNMVPGVEPSMDKMLQGRLFSYPDTHRHRLGPNFDQIPINCPYRAKVANYQRDGPMATDGNQKGHVNYEPNSLGGPEADPSKAWHKHKVIGTSGRYEYDHGNDDFAQPRTLFSKVMNQEERDRLCKNMGGHLNGCRTDLKEKALKMLHKCHPDYAAGVAKHIGMEVPKAAKL